MLLDFRSFPQLRATFEEFAKIANKEIEDTIKSEMSGDLKRGMLAIGELIDVLYECNVSGNIFTSFSPYILAYRSIFWLGKRFSEATRLIRALCFLLAEGKMFSAILDTQHYRTQPNKSQSWNKLSHRCLLIHYCSINNNSFSPNCYLDLTNMLGFM